MGYDGIQHLAMRTTTAVWKQQFWDASVTATNPQWFRLWLLSPNNSITYSMIPKSEH